MNTITNTPACTCPSGDGSLAWPCPAHAPAAPQDERALFEAACVAAGIGQPWQENLSDSQYLYQRDQDRFIGWSLARAALSAQAAPVDLRPHLVWALRGIEPINQGDRYAAARSALDAAQAGQAATGSLDEQRHALGLQILRDAQRPDDIEYADDEQADALAAPVQYVAPTVMHECCMDGMPCQGCELRGVVAKDVAPTDAVADFCAKLHAALVSQSPFGYDQTLLGQAATQAGVPAAPREVMRFNLRGGLVNPESRGMYVRYEDHVAALAAQHAAQPTCPTCNDHGMIGGPSFSDPGEGGVPWPDCAAAQPADARGISDEWMPFALTLNSALDRGEPAALLMDENSPLRGELRRLIDAARTQEGAAS